MKDDILTTESILKELEELCHKDLMTLYYAGLIDEDKFNELMDEVDTFKDMTSEELHILFDLMRGEKLG